MYVLFCLISKHQTKPSEGNPDVNECMSTAQVTEEEGVSSSEAFPGPASSWGEKLSCCRGGSYPASWESEDKWAEAPPGIPWDRRGNRSSPHTHIQSPVSLASCWGQLPSPKNTGLASANSYFRTTDTHKHISSPEMCSEWYRGREDEEFIKGGKEIRDFSLFCTMMKREKNNPMKGYRPLTLRSRYVSNRFQPK